MPRKKPPAPDGLTPLTTFIPATTAETRAESERFSPMLQGTGTNRLTQITTHRRNPDVDEITGEATITNEDLTVFISSYDQLTGGLRVSTHKLLDICTISLTSQNDYRGDGRLNTRVSIPLDRYMELCGIPFTKASKDKTRRKVHEDLDALYAISLEWRESTGKQMKDFGKMRICDMVGIENGYIVMNFSQAMAEYLTHAYITQYPMDLLKTDERNPTSYFVGKKLSLHYHMENNKKKGTSNIISVRALLEATPDIPTYEEVKKADRMYARRIIAPLEVALDALPTIARWEYCNAKKMPLSKEQMHRFTYQTFIECYIHFEIVEGGVRALPVGGE